MDVAYDQITKESYPEDPPSKAASTTSESKPDSAPDPSTQSFAGEVRDVYQNLQSSAWGTTLGSFWGSVKKQGESYIDSAKREFEEASSASRGLSDADLANSTKTLTVAEDGSTPTAPVQTDNKEQTQVPESLTADIAKEAGVLLSQFRTEAASSLKTVQTEAGSRLTRVQVEAGRRLKQVQQAEEAADEALAAFGGSVRDYLRDAITISAPETGDDGTVKSLLFESRDTDGRRVVHATRFDAQLHVVHANLDSFTRDPDSAEYAPWTAAFDAGAKTDAIAADLAKYDALRRAMEALVPEKVEYAAFWTRYYFLRHVIEEQERRRRDLLRAQADDEEVGWGDEEEDEDEPAAPSTPKPVRAGKDGKESKEAEQQRCDADLLRPAEGRRSTEHSVADSDASYDIVSADASRGPGSPREATAPAPAPAATAPKKAAAGGADSDEEDWE